MVVLKRLISILSLIIPALGYGQDINPYFGVGFLAYSETGFPTEINGVEAKLRTDSNYKGESFAPELTVFAGVNWNTSNRLSLQTSIEYTRYLTAFSTVDYTVDTGSLPPLRHVVTYKMPYLKHYLTANYDILRSKKSNIYATAGIINQFLIRDRNNYPEFSLNRDDEKYQRSVDMMNQIPLSFNPFNLLYTYGLGATINRVDFSFVWQNYFSGSFTGNIQFEGVNKRLISKRRMFRFAVAYRFAAFKKESNKNEN